MPDQCYQLALNDSWKMILFVNNANLPMQCLLYTLFDYMYLCFKCLYNKRKIDPLALKYLYLKTKYHFMELHTFDTQTLALITKRQNHLSHCGKFYAALHWLCYWLA